MSGVYVPFEENFVGSDFVAMGAAPVQFTQDYAEANKLNQFYPGAGQPGAPAWYEQAALYGITRGIDAAFMTATANKTAAPATYAGANGRTYTVGQAGEGLAGVPPLLLLLIAGGLIFALAD